MRLIKRIEYSLLTKLYGTAIFRWTYTYRLSRSKNWKDRLNAARSRYTSKRTLLRLLDEGGYVGTAAGSNTLFSSADIERYIGEPSCKRFYGFFDNPNMTCAMILAYKHKYPNVENVQVTAAWALAARVHGLKGSYWQWNRISTYPVVPSQLGRAEDLWRKYLDA